MHLELCAFLVLILSLAGWGYFLIRRKPRKKASTLEAGSLLGAPNGDRAEQAETWLQEALDSRFHFEARFLERHDWVVVPVESALHFDELDARRLSRAAASTGNGKLRAVLLEDLEGVGNHLEVDATEGAFSRYSKECSHFNYALIPDDRSFAIICTTNDYFLLGGEKRFVEMALGKSITDARAEFEAFAVNFGEPDTARLMKVHRRYS